MTEAEFVGRRVSSVSEVMEPGDYCGPISGFTADKVACVFRLPLPAGSDSPPGARSLHFVTFPPHTYRECPDGSLEIRASIGADPLWHGYLDEGYRWRTV